MVQRRSAIQIGIEPAPDCVRMVAVAGDGVIGAIEIETAEGSAGRAEACARALAALERQGVPRPRGCVAVAPASAMVTSVLELPPRSSGAPIDDLAATELSRGLEGAGIEVAVFPVHEPASGPTEYLVAGARRDDILALVDDLDRCGVRIDAVEPPVWSLRRACGPGSHFVVDVTQSGIGFHVLRHGEAIMSRSVSLAGHALTAELLVAEIDRCAAYLASRRQAEDIEDVVLVGAGAADPDLVDVVAREFDVRVRAWSSADALPPAFAAAFGAALRDERSEAA